MDDAFGGPDRQLIKEIQLKKYNGPKRQIDRLNRQFMLQKVKKAQENYKQELVRLYKESLRPDSGEAEK